MLNNDNKKSSNLTIKESEVILETAIESLPFDVFMINKDGYYTMQNSTCKQHWGDVIGKRPEDVVNSKDTLTIWKNNNSRAFSGEIVKGEVSFKINGEIKYFYNIISPIYINNEIQYIIGINIDITDHKFAEQKLKESEDKFRTIANKSLLGIAILQDGKFKYLNERFANLSGRTVEEVKDRGPREFINVVHPEDREIFIKYLEKRQLGIDPKGSEYECRCFKKHGEIMWVQTFSKTITFNGKFAELITILDITDQKFAEQKLKESEEKFRTMAEQSLMGICIIQDFEIKYLNQQMADIYGYPLTEINQWKPSEFVKVIHPDYREMVMDQIKKKQQGSTNVMTHYIAKIITRSGKVRCVENYSKPITYQGKPANLLTQIDITPKMIAEQKVRESEEKYRHLYESSPYAILLVNMQGKVIDCNKAAEFLSGFKRSELIGKSFADTSFIPNEYIYSIIEDYKTIIKNGILEPREIQLFTREKKPVWVSFQASTLQFENEKVIQVLIEKIDERKKSEQKLKESEEKYHSLFENSPIAFTIQDYSEIKNYIDHLKSKGISDFEKFFDENPDEVLKFMTKIKIIDVNKRTLEIYNAKNKEEYFERIKKIGENFLEELTEDVLRSNKMELLCLINGDRVYESETISRKFTGEPIYLYAKTSIVPDYEDTWSNVIVSILDITDEKLTEQKLKLSEEKYHQLYETSPDGVILTDVKGKIIECNSAIEKITGYSSEELIGKNFKDLDVYIEDGLDRLIKDYEDLLGDQRLNAVEVPIETKDGDLKWLQINSNILSMQEELFLLTVIHDITSLKQAEKALKESEKKFRDILETSSVGVMELDVIKKKLLYINPKLLNIIGFEEQELTEDILRNNIIHPKDLNKLFMTNEEAELEFRITDKQGKLKWLAGKRIPHYNEEGEISSIRVWLDDITEKKMYENLIYELNINFLNFTTNIRNNIDLLLNTCIKLLNGDMILYIHKIISDDQENYEIITTEKTYTYNAEEFNELFISALFDEEHDFPQTFFDIDKTNYAKSDPFIREHTFKGCFGKVIKSHEGLNSAVCIFYKNYPILSGEDKLVLFLICDALEIEQRRWQVQQDLEKQNVTLNKINKLKTELFSRTSHELKTPLISVKGFTELLLTLYKSKLDPEIISILNEIKDGGKRLEKIINLLLDSTKLEAGQLSLNLHDEDLTFLIKFCVNELHGLVKLRDQSISLNLHNKLETKFDKERIYEVISNLLVNAIKYTPPGGNIAIESKINKDFYEISIKDNGIGFVEEEKNQVFKQFGKIERYGQGWDVAADGTGLGLYITKKLVELHGGNVWFESEGRNKGTTFHFTIPIIK